MALEYVFLVVCRKLFQHIMYLNINSKITLVIEIERALFAINNLYVAFFFIEWVRLPDFKPTMNMRGGGMFSESKEQSWTVAEGTEFWSYFYYENWIPTKIIHLHKILFYISDTHVRVVESFRHERPDVLHSRQHHTLWLQHWENVEGTLNWVQKTLWNLPYFVTHFF